MLYLDFTVQSMVCHYATKTGRAIVFSGQYLEVTVEQLEHLWKL